jgi:hypothetical protein
MKITTTEPVSIRISDVKPIDARFVQIVSEYLDRIHDRISTKPYPYHVRLLTARPPLISYTQAQVISTAFIATHGNQSVLPRWVKDSVILWDRELIEFEKLSRSGLAINV